MAFSEAQRVQIRFYLGFPDVFQSQNHRLESAMDIIGARPDAEANVVAILAELAAADTALGSASSSAAGSLRKVDEVEFFQQTSATGANEARKHGRMWAGRLSIAIGVQLVGDVYGGAGYQGDSWQGPYFQNSGTIQLG